MVEKTTIRSTDRKKLNKYKLAIYYHFKEHFNSDPFCNRCHKVTPLTELEIAHIDYHEFWRFAELLCKPCHEKVDAHGTLPKFLQIRHMPPQTIMAFQKELPGILIESRLEDKRLLITNRVKIPPNTQLNIKLPMNFI